MTRMLNLGNVLELVNDGLDYRALAGQQLVTEAHQVILHVAFGFGKEGNAISTEQLVHQALGDVASVGEDFAEEGLQQLHHRLVVINIAWCQPQVEQFTMFVDYQM